MLEVFNGGDHVFESVKFCSHPSHDFLLAVLTFLFGNKGYHHDTLVYFCTSADANGTEILFCLGLGCDNCFQLIQPFCRLFKRGARGKFKSDLKLGRVGLGNEFGSDESDEIHADYKGSNGNKNCGPAICDGPFQGPSIDTLYGQKGIFKNYV